MKLRNKKTGEIQAVQHNVALLQFSSGKTSSYHSLAELNEDWEDYKDPLIKEEKVRKAVRAWAEANYIVKDGYNNCKVEFDWGEHRLKWIETSIEFNEITGLENLEDGEVYTIAELCGEEEE